jgi:hypothetical protein
VDAFRLAQAAQPTDFDIDDPAASQVERFARVFDGMDALVQTDRCFQLRLQFGVVDDVVVVERLLDHHQVQVAERFQPRTCSGCRDGRPSWAAMSRASGQRSRTALTKATSRPGRFSS